MNLIAIARVFIVNAAKRWSSTAGGQLPGSMRSRACQGRDWQRRFPDASKREIRDFLGLFVGAFAFRDDQKLRLNPEDSILDIYRALYPKRYLPDALEVETLAKEIWRKHGLELSSV